MRLDLRKFLESYAEEVPENTVFECNLLTMRANITPSPDLRFSDKAYDLFRVIEQDDGTVDILLDAKDEIDRLNNTIKQVVDLYLSGLYGTRSFRRRLGTILDGFIPHKNENGLQ